MKINHIIISALILFITGCANTSIYHWGDYSDTLYSYTKEPTSESKLEHKAELIKIINLAKSKKKMIPPGINFELAMLLVTEGDNDGAIKYFNQEKILFPESEKYVALALKEMEVN
jgi:hypothetical protein